MLKAAHNRRAVGRIYFASFSFLMSLQEVGGER